MVVPPKGKYFLCNSDNLCPLCFVVYDMRKRKQVYECGEGNVDCVIFMSKRITNTLKKEV